MAAQIHKAYAGLPKSDLEYWDRLLRADRVDYSAEKLAPYSCVYSWSVEFDDRFSADIRVCTDSADSGSVWSEMILYDPAGIEVELSPVSDTLSGDWSFDLPESRYYVRVGLDRFEAIGTTERRFKQILRKELLSGVSKEYLDDIVDCIAEQVAEDVEECADPDNWNSCDVSLGAGRVILKALGVEV